jgi:hypothetical protein
MKELTITIRKATKNEFDRLYKIFQDEGYGDGRRPLPIIENSYAVTFDDPRNEKTGSSTWTITKDETIGQLVDDIKKRIGEL